MHWRRARRAMHTRRRVRRRVRLIEHGGMRDLRRHGDTRVEGRVLLLLMGMRRGRRIPIHRLRSVLEARLHKSAKVDGVGVSMMRVTRVGRETVLARVNGRLREMLSRNEGPRSAHAPLGDEESLRIRGEMLRDKGRRKLVLGARCEDGRRRLGPVGVVRSQMRSPAHSNVILLLGRVEGLVAVRPLQWDVR